MIFQKSMIGQELLIFVKSTLVISFVWLFDGLFLSLAQISFLGENTREMMVELKELISLIVSVLVLIITAIKLAKLIKNKKIEEDEDNA